MKKYIVIDRKNTVPYDVHYQSHEPRWGIAQVGVDEKYRWYRMTGWIFVKGMANEICKKLNG